MSTSPKLERPEAYHGKKPTTDGEDVKTLLNRGMKPVDVAKKLGISRAIVYGYK